MVAALFINVLLMRKNDGCIMHDILNRENIFGHPVNSRGKWGNFP
jgi:hypothetical protein